MVDKFIIMDTVLGPQRTRTLADELLPTQVIGQEGISTPFFYDLTMVRDPTEKGLLDPRKLIGTPVRFGLLTRQEHATQYSFRTGVFQTFNRMPRAAAGCLVYSGRVVPAFAMLGQQTRYRVFENQTVVQVIRTVLQEMAGNPLFRFDISRLHDADFVPVEYTVQFGESDFSFLCRLMNRYGIWYIFGHPKDTSSAKGAGALTDAINNTLVLGVGRIDVPTPCDLSKLTVKASKKGGQVGPSSGGDDDPPEPTDLVEFRRLYEPPLARISGADFNLLNPHVIQPVSKTVLSDYNLTQALDDVTREEFAVRADADPAGSSGVIKGGTLADGVFRRIHELEAQTFTIAGGSTNSTLLPGRSFEIIDDENHIEKSSKYLVRTTVITAYENSYFTSSLQDLGAFFATLGLDIVSPITNIFTQPGGQGLVDLALGATQAGLNNYLQNEQAYAWETKLYPDHSLPDKTLFWPATLGGITQGALGGLVGLIGKGVDDAIKQTFLNNAGAYSNSFVAIPFRDTTGFLAPSPRAETPRARGPHIAVVIGPDGTNDTKAEVHADAIGRVRVRFAWDIAAERWDQLGKQPLACNDSTCWVRVTDAWAGAKFGTQFLPRIGQEVVVEFLDGDPERPLVTGRLYNATTAKLPFPSPGAEKTQIAKISDLPATAAHDITRSGIKTHSMGAGADAGFNMLRFDDKSGKEQLLLRSEGRHDETALRSRYETSHGARHVSVVSGKAADGSTVGGNAFTSVAGEADLDVGGGLLLRAKGKVNLQATGDVDMELKADAHVKVTGSLAVNADKIVLEGATQLTLKVGNSFVVLTPGAVYINGATVNVNSGGSPGEAGAFDITDPAAATAADPGTPPDWLQQHQQQGGGGGGSRTHRVHPLPSVLVKPTKGDLTIGGFTSVPINPPAGDPPATPYVPLPPPPPPPITVP